MPARLKNGAVGISRKMKTPATASLLAGRPPCPGPPFRRAFPRRSPGSRRAGVDGDALADELVGRGRWPLPRPFAPGTQWTRQPSSSQGPDVLDGLVRMPVDDDVGAPVQGPVARRAIADARSGQPVLARDHPLAGERLPRGENDGPGLDEGVLGRDELGIGVQAEGDGVPGDDLGPEPAGMVLELPEELERVDRRESGIVLDLVAQGHAGGGPALEDDGRLSRPRPVDRGREPGRPGADDQDIGFDVVHMVSVLLRSGVRAPYSSKTPRRAGNGRAAHQSPAVPLGWQA